MKPHYFKKNGCWWLVTNKAYKGIEQPTMVISCEMPRKVLFKL